jgi:drug/metabolite transporter (DMT)-like permease
MKSSLTKYLLGLLIFGSNGIIASFIDMPSYEIVLMRAIFGVTLLFILFYMTGHRPTVMKHKRDLLFIALSGIAMAGDWLFLFEGYRQIGVGLASLLNYFGPVIVVALSPLFFNERLTPVKLISLLAALFGVVLISGDIMTGNANIWGITCGIASAFAYSALVIADKKAEHVKGFENAIFQLLFAAITVVVFFVFKHGFTIDIAAGDWLPILCIGFINTGIGCFLYFSSIGHLPAQSVAICGYLEPLSAVLMSAIFLHETLLPLQITGAALIIAGALFSECFSYIDPRRLLQTTHLKRL